MNKKNKALGDRWVGLKKTYSEIRVFLERRAKKSLLTRISPDKFKIILQTFRNAHQGENEGRESS